MKINEQETSSGWLLPSSTKYLSQHFIPLNASIVHYSLFASFILAVIVLVTILTRKLFSRASLDSYDLMLSKHHSLGTTATTNTNISPSSSSSLPGGPSSYPKQQTTFPSWNMITSNQNHHQALLNAIQPPVCQQQRSSGTKKQLFVDTSGKQILTSSISSVESKFNVDFYDTPNKQHPHCHQQMSPHQQFDGIPTTVAKRACSPNDMKYAQPTQSLSYSNKFKEPKTVEQPQFVQSCINRRDSVNNHYDSICSLASFQKSPVYHQSQQLDGVLDKRVYDTADIMNTVRVVPYPVSFSSIQTHTLNADSSKHITPYFGKPVQCLDKSKKQDCSKDLADIPLSTDNENAIDEGNYDEDDEEQQKSSSIHKLRSQISESSTISVGSYSRKYGHISNCNDVENSIFDRLPESRDTDQENYELPSAHLYEEINVRPTNRDDHK